LGVGGNGEAGKRGGGGGLQARRRLNSLTISLKKKKKMKSGQSREYGSLSSGLFKGRKKKLIGEEGRYTKKGIAEWGLSRKRFYSLISRGW